METGFEKDVKNYYILGSMLKYLKVERILMKKMFCNNAFHIHVPTTQFFLRKMSKLADLLLSNISHKDKLKEL